jgi:hypothetical protein
VRRGVGRTGAEGVMVGRAGGTRAVDVAATAAGQSACFAVRSEEGESLVGVAVRSAAAKLVGQSGAAEAEKQYAAAAGSEGLAVGYLMPTGFAVAENLAAVGTGSSSVVRPELDRLAHAAARLEARGLARFEG